MSSLILSPKLPKPSRRLIVPVFLIAALFAFSAHGKRDRTHTVRSGDSIARIADYYGVAQEDLCAANGIERNSPLRIGQELVIPSVLRGGSKGHKIRPGDTLSSIAGKHKVSVTQLAAANKMEPDTPLEVGRTLVIPDTIDPQASRSRPSRRAPKVMRTGKKVKGGVSHTVQSGQTVWLLARSYNVSVDDIMRANGIGDDNPLRVDQELFIPGAKRVVAVPIKGYSVIPTQFYSMKHNKRLRLKLVSKSGSVSQRARRLLSQISAPKTVKRGPRYKLLHPRLIQILQKISEQFPGQTIEIISGYRPRKRGGGLSKHNIGRALDFRLQGVPNRRLYNFISGFPNTGCGYYPNSTFVHLDVRNHKTDWTDMSGPGEKARYINRRRNPEADADAGDGDDEEEQTDDRGDGRVEGDGEEEGGEDAGASEAPQAQDVPAEEAPKELPARP